jgi:starch synthase
LQAARYGAVPVAFAADAARDVIVDADAELETGTGFLFDSLTQRGILGGLGRAVSAYRRANFLKLLSRVMRQDLAWDRPARRYLQIYRQAAGGAR